MKKIISLLLSIIFLTIPLAVSAQESAQSNTVITQFGNPIGLPPALPALNNTVALPPLEWDQKIVNALRPGLRGYFNNLSTNITNGTYSTGTWLGADNGSIYWCTYSIVDSYNLAGISGLSKGLHAAVVNMHQFWVSPQANSLGYKFLDYPNNNNLLRSVKPGYAIFMEQVLLSHTGQEHVAMLKIISLDSRGNGFIDTNDSNSSSKSNHYPVIEWSIKNTAYPVRGMGGI